LHPEYEGELKCLILRSKNAALPKSRETMRAKRPALEVILADGNAGDRDSLKNVLEGTPWVVVDAEAPAIESVIRESGAPIVIFDGQSDCWRTTIRSLKKARRNVCVLVLSDGGNALSRDEVVQYGGFDIITRPFDRKQVLPILVFAYTYCRGYGLLLSHRARRVRAFPETRSLVPTAASR
jgi:DNA-binding response OmpR family regulator